MGSTHVSKEVVPLMNGGVAGLLREILLRGGTIGLIAVMLIGINYFVSRDNLVARERDTDRIVQANREVTAAVRESNSILLANQLKIIELLREIKK